jgi:hypothetical protein
MAKRITEFTSATVLAETDVLPVVDLSDTTQATSGTTKKLALSLIADYLKARVETLTNKTINVSDNTLSGMLDWFYPIGTIYETTSTDLDTTTKMGNHFGGTWESYGDGRVLVGKSADTEFDTIGETGGAKTITLEITQIPSHKHAIKYGITSPGDGSGLVYCTTTGSNVELEEAAGGGQAHSNLQPYIVVYRYRRVS